MTQLEVTPEATVSVGGQVGLSPGHSLPVCWVLGWGAGMRGVRELQSHLLPPQVLRKLH